jgi:hypothetical protein
MEAAIADYISPIAAVFSLVVAIFATVAAFRAASAAKMAVENTVRAERRATLREMLATRTSVEIEALQITIVAQQLKDEARSMFKLGGASGGSAEADYLASIDEVAKPIHTIMEKVEPFARDYTKLSEVSADDIAIKLSNLEAWLIAVRSARDYFLRQQGDVRARSATYREQREARQP